MVNHGRKWMNTEFINQYAHTWRMFEGIVHDFDLDAWLHTGRGSTTPARIAFHILKGVRYYIEDPTTIHFASGKSFESDWATVKEEDFPSQKDMGVHAQWDEGESQYMAV